MRRIICLIALCALVLAGCAPPADGSQATPLRGATPDQAATDQASKGQTPAAPQGQIGKLSPASLEVKVIAWGAPTDGDPDALPAAALFTASSGPSSPLGLGSQLESGWVESLPAEVRAALSRPPGEGEWLVLLYGGAQPCPAYWVSAYNLQVDGRSLKIDWRVEPPPPDTGCAAVTAFPYLLLSLPGAAQYADEVKAENR